MLQLRKLDMSKNRDKERKRKLYKELKKAKLFSKFCLIVANAFESPVYNAWGETSRMKFKHYMNSILKDYKPSEFPFLVDGWGVEDNPSAKIQM